MSKHTAARPIEKQRNNPIGERARNLAVALGIIVLFLCGLVDAGGELFRCAVLSSPWAQTTMGTVAEKHYVSGRYVYFHEEVVYRVPDPGTAAPALPFVEWFRPGEVFFHDLAVVPGAFERSGRVDQDTYDRVKPGDSISLRYLPGAPWLARLDAERLHGFDHFLRFLIFFGGALLSALVVVSGVVNLGRYVLSGLDPALVPIGLGRASGRVESWMAWGVFQSVRVQRVARPSLIGLAALLLVAGAYFYTVL